VLGKARPPFSSCNDAQTLQAAVAGTPLPLLDTLDVVMHRQVADKAYEPRHEESVLPVGFAIGLQLLQQQATADAVGWA